MTFAFLPNIPARMILYIRKSILTMYLIMNINKNTKQSVLKRKYDLSDFGSEDEGFVLSKNCSNKKKYLLQQK